VALHTPDSAKFQRRVGHMKLLGEMYNYRLMDSLYPPPARQPIMFRRCNAFNPIFVQSKSRTNVSLEFRCTMRCANICPL